jgi:hypothetical protein
MLVKLGLKTPESLRQKIQNKRYLLLLTLTRLLKGYGSCFAPVSTVYLALQKRLLREHCSGITCLYFNQIYYLKKELVFVSL